jgi:hypothetical protein
VRAFLVDLWSHRGFRYTFLTVAVIAAFWLLLHLVLNWSGEKRWQRIKTQLESEGETFDFYALYPPPIPDDQNFCAIEPLNGIRTPEGSSPEAVAAQKKRDAIKAAAKLIHFNLMTAVVWDGLGRGETPDGLAILEAAAKYPIRKTSLPSMTWAELRLALESQVPMLVQLSQEARKRTQADYLPRPTREELPEMLIMLSVPQFNAGQSLGNLGRFYSVVCFQSGDPQSSFNSALVLLRLSDAADASRTLIGYLVGVTQRTQFFSLLWLQLHGRHLSESDLAMIQADLSQEDRQHAFLHALRSEMAVGVRSMESLEAKPRDRWASITMASGTATSSSVGSVLSSLIPGGYITHSKAALIELERDWVLNPLKNQGLRHIQGRAAAMDAHLHSISYWREPDKILANLALPTFTVISGMSAHHENQRLQSILACALERHFLRHGSYPATLETLDPEFRGKNDLLDVNGEKMHYALVPGGRFRLWSPGPDGRDDGGKFGVELGGSRQPSSPHYLGDWVWRYDPAVKAP